MQKQRIVILANTAWYLYNFRTNLIRMLSNKGWDVSLLVPFDEYYHELETLEGVQVYQIKQLSRKGRNPVQDYRLYREIYKYYKALRPGVVLQYTVKPNIYGSMAAKKLGIPALSVVPGLGHAFVYPGMLKAIVTWLYRVALRSNRYIIFENAEDMHELVGRNVISPQQARVFKGCGIDTVHFAPAVADRSNSAVRFLFMGRLIREKGVAEFVQAAHIVRERYPHVRFYIAGNIDTENPGGISPEQFRKMIASDGIEYLGFVQDVREVIRDADCVVLPSYYPEGLPRVLLESISMETPVISTDTRGCRDAIENGRSGFLAKPRDSADLAKQMIEFYKMSPDARTAMGRYGRQKALTEFDDKIINHKYLDLLESAIGVGP